MTLRKLVFLFLFLPSLGFSQSENLPELIGDYMDNLEGFSGVVMVAYQGKPLFIEGYGMVDEEKEIPIDANTLFDIGSITKSFTATAILVLSERGKLSVQDPISVYFPELPDEKGAITINQLLTHSSGLPGALGMDYDAIDRTDFLKAVQSAELLFEPGSSYEYSNVGYSLLAMIIEDLSGMTYDSFLQNEVIFPAKMLLTGYSPRGVEYIPMASGIAADGSDWGTPRDKTWDDTQPYWHLRGNGGLLSSASDMFRYYRALRSGILLGGEATKAQFSPHVDEGGGYSYYGYGWVIMDEGEHIAHNGGNGIFKADFHWLPTKDYALFAVSNNAKIPLFRISEDLMGIILTGEVEEKPLLEEVELESFPANPRQEVAKQLFDIIVNLNESEAESFLQTGFSPGIIERNGEERLLNIFDMLHEDHPDLQLLGVAEGADYIQLLTSSETEGSTLTFLIKFLENQIDGIELEAN